jgi:transcriptional regulator with XRE-family HTH domain
MHIHVIVGDNIRCLRARRQWSQEELGSRTGLNHDYLGRLERGLENIGVDNLSKIAAVFGIEPFNLLIENFCSADNVLRNAA